MLSITIQNPILDKSGSAPFYEGEILRPRLIMTHTPDAEKTLHSTPDAVKRNPGVSPFHLAVDMRL